MFPCRLLHSQTCIFLTEFSLIQYQSGAFPPALGVHLHSWGAVFVQCWLDAPQGAEPPVGTGTHGCIESLSAPREEGLCNQPRARSRLPGTVRPAGWAERLWPLESRKAPGALLCPGERRCGEQGQRQNSALAPSSTASTGSQRSS